MPQQGRASVGPALARLVRKAIEDHGGWLPFDRYMAMALYAPGLGYYANAGRTFGAWPESGSDFVTAPELSPLFGRALARQLRQALDASGTRELWEFGAGSGALAAELLDVLGDAVERYTLVDVSGSLRARQQERLAAHAGRVRWLDALPDAMRGVIVGNEVLDAMPVRLVRFDGVAWHERGVVVQGEGFAFADARAEVEPPAEDMASVPYPAGYTTERHDQACAFVATLADRLERGAAFFIDYGFPAHEYFHPQRDGGTLMCHRAHLADTDPLVDIGTKDITAHVDFSAVALAAQDAGFEVIGYTSQARFLVDCGILDSLATADPRERARAQKLLAEHEMGELFKVLGLAKGCAFEPIGFATGDRTHTL